MCAKSEQNRCFGWIIVVGVGLLLKKVPAFLNHAYISPACTCSTLSFLLASVCGTKPKGSARLNWCVCSAGWYSSLSWRRSWVRVPCAPQIERQEICSLFCVIGLLVCLTDWPIRIISPIHPKTSMLTIGCMFATPNASPSHEGGASAANVFIR